MNRRFDSCVGLRRGTGRNDERSSGESKEEHTWSKALTGATKMIALASSKYGTQVCL